MKRAWLPVSSFLLSGAAVIASLLLPHSVPAQSHLAQPSAPVTRVDEDRLYPAQSMAEQLAETTREINERSKNLTDAAVVENINAGINKLLGLCKQRVQTPIKPEDGELIMGIYALLYMYRLNGDERLHFNSKDMQPLIKYLCELKATQTYVLGLQASALSTLPEKPEFRTPLKAIRDSLVKGARNAGNYTYSTAAAAGVWDNSNSQYGVLGIWACDDAGVEVDNAYWKLCDTHWRRTQSTDGGWYYKPTGKPGSPGAQAVTGGTTSMTAAGLASLYVMAEHLDTTVRLDPLPDAALEKGLVWMEKDFPGARMTMDTDLYTTYGIERVGLASGYKYFGKYNWYRDGAGMLVSRGPNAWTYHNDIVGCGYALLFLARGRIPIAFTKLQYTGPWNARPRDVANLSKWLYKRTERYINWQIVGMKNAEPEDWLDGPILVITGHNDPKFGKEEIDKLRRFVRAGGLIFSSADGNDKTFTDAICKNYAPAIFDNAYEMRQLPRDHFVYNMDYKLETGKNNDLMGLSNGVRECWIHSPKDMGASWQRYAKATNEHFDLPMNIYLYASGRHSLRSKLDSVAVIDTGRAAGSKFSVARLKYAGNYDPEPGAMDRFAKLYLRERTVGIELSTVACEEADPAKNPILVMTGSAHFTLGDPQVNALRKYLEGGGFLIADDTGGKGDFTASLQASLSRVFKGAEGKEIDVTQHPVMTGKLNNGAGTKPDDLLRKYATSNELRGKKARVWEYKIKDRVVALVFEADVTSGLLGTNTWGIFGYNSTASEAIMWNAMQYALANPLKVEEKK